MEERGQSNSTGQHKLDLQKKEVEIDGTVDMLQYSGTPGRGVFGKWFG